MKTEDNIYIDIFKLIIILFGIQKILKRKKSLFELNENYINVKYFEKSRCIKNNWLIRLVL